MADKPPSPLNSRVPIVDPRTGFPTAQFIQTWVRQLASNNSIPTTAAGMSALLDLIGSTQGSILIRGAHTWGTLTSPGGTTEFLRADGSWATPDAATTLAALTDVSIPTPQDGNSLIYDAATSKWVAGGGGHSNPPASQWRLQLSATNNGNPNTGFNGVAFRATPGGTNIAPTTVIVDTTAFGTAATLPNMATTVNGFWLAPAGAVHTVEYDFPTAVSVNEFAFIIANDGSPAGSQCVPTGIDVQYFDGTTWQTAWSVSGIAPAFTLTPIVFTDPSYAPPSGPPSLASLTDVAIPAPTAGQVLTYDATAMKWVSDTPASPTVPPLSTLPDVNIPTPTNGQVLTFDTGTSKWLANTPATPPAQALAGLTDVAIPAPANGQFLTYDTGTAKWVASTLTIATPALSTLPDVNIPAPTNGQVLTFDTASSKWLATAIPAQLPVGANGSFLGFAGGIPAWRTAAQTKTDLALNNVDNTTDAGKPVSTAQAAAIAAAVAAKALATLVDVNVPAPTNGQVLTFDTASSKWLSSSIPAQLPAGGANTDFLGFVAGAAAWRTVANTKIDLALDQVNNTSDAAKPVSTAQATAIALKANIANPSFTGLVRLTDVGNPADNSRVVYAGGLASVAAGAGVSSGGLVARGYTNPINPAGFEFWSGGATRLTLDNTGSLTTFPTLGASVIPTTDNTVGLGNATHTYTGVWAANATIGGDAAGSAILQINSTAGTNKDIRFTSVSVLRWIMRIGGTESGTNTGTDLSFQSRTDAGGVLATPLLITRSTGIVSFSSAPKVPSFTVATLPTAGTSTRGCLAFATNGRAFNGLGVMELAGAGTGTLVSDNGTAWKIVGTNVTVLA